MLSIYSLEHDFGDNDTPSKEQSRQEVTEEGP